MTRIIAGRAGSITLEVPAEGTRPTSDRVRESLFGALEAADLLEGAVVCDLYAGSGALGLEAVSRGAASADLVERSPRAATAATRNADRVTRAVGGSARVRVHRTSVQAYLKNAVQALLTNGTGPFDIIFLDPPYDVGEQELTEALRGAGRLLSPEGVVVVERARRSPAPDWEAADLRADRDRSYGDTVLWWGRSVSSDGDDAEGDATERHHGSERGDSAG